MDSKTAAQQYKEHKRTIERAEAWYNDPRTQAMAPQLGVSLAGILNTALNPWECVETGPKKGKFVNKREARSETQAELCKDLWMGIRNFMGIGKTADGTFDPRPYDNNLFAALVETSDEIPITEGLVHLAIRKLAQHAANAGVRDKRRPLKKDRERELTPEEVQVAVEGILSQGASPASSYIYYAKKDLAEFAESALADI